MDKTKLPGDTYERWLGTNKERSTKTRGSEKPAQDSYETWIGKRVESKKRETGSTS